MQMRCRTIRIITALYHVYTQMESNSTKTAMMNWEQYKDQNSIMKEIYWNNKQPSTTVYLPKQEFLQRVDQRK